MRLSSSQFFSISRCGPPMDSWWVCPRLSPRPRESISRVLFYLARNNFWLYRSAHKFPLGNVVQIRARRRRTACAHSSSIQLTRIELLQRTRSSSGCQMGGVRQAKGGSREVRFRPPRSAEPQGRTQLHFVKLAGRKSRAPRLGARTPRPKLTLFGGSRGSFDSGKGVDYLFCLGTGWCAGLMRTKVRNGSG